MNYLIDSDILIYSLKGNERVVSNFENHLHSPKSISVITYGELVYGAHKSTHPEKNLARIHRISEIFPLIQISPAVMMTFGELKARLSSVGNTVADMDLLIASTAITYNLILVTNNERHFSKIPDLEYENWSV